VGPTWKFRLLPPAPEDRRGDDQWPLEAWAGELRRASPNTGMVESSSNSQIAIGSGHPGCGRRGSRARKRGVAPDPDLSGQRQQRARRPSSVPPRTRASAAARAPTPPRTGSRTPLAHPAAASVARHRRRGAPRRGPARGRARHGPQPTEASKSSVMCGSNKYPQDKGSHTARSEDKRPCPLLPNSDKALAVEDKAISDIARPPAPPDEARRPGLQAAIGPRSSCAKGRRQNLHARSTWK